MHTINIEQALIEDNRTSHFNKPQPKGWSVRFVFVSIFAHAVVIFVIFNNLNLSNHTPLPNPQEPAKIKSYLYIPLSKVSEPAIEEPVIDKNGPEVEVEQITPDEKVMPIKSNEESKAQVHEQVVNKADEEVTSIAEPSTELLETNTFETETSILNTPIPSALNNSKLHTDISKYGLRGTIQQQLQNVEMKRYSEMAQTASQEFSTNITSPTIDAPVYTEEYQYLKEPGVSEIECDGSIKSNLTIMSSVMGGKVKCREKNFQMYINKHLNKETEGN